MRGGISLRSHLAWQQEPGEVEDYALWGGGDRCRLELADSRLEKPVMQLEQEEDSY